MSEPRPGLSPSILAALQTRTPLLWVNPERPAGAPSGTTNIDLIQQAYDRFERAKPLLAALFDELPTGEIDSPLVPLRAMPHALGLTTLEGQLFVKADHLLPVAGSIKARGGFHEVISYAESLAISAGLTQAGNDLDGLASPEARSLFSGHTISVGSTGNLGLSIGTMAAALGFKANVHMSSEAKEWKKAALRSRGACVIEHEGDYAKAVANGRAQSLVDPNGYFVDDENSELLLAGYAAAAWSLAKQLEQAGRSPSATAPLFVYIPCGVGGAPGGIALGLNMLFGPHVHCFFAEPVSSACMLVRLAGGKPASVYDHGLDNRTCADGLAVPNASDLVARRIASVVSGVYTVTDEQMYSALLRAWQEEELELEPSAAAGFAGPEWILGSEAGLHYVEKERLTQTMPAATHVVWTTGGSLQPREEHLRLRATATQLEAV